MNTGCSFLCHKWDLNEDHGVRMQPNPIYYEKGLYILGFVTYLSRSPTTFIPKGPVWTLLRTTNIWRCILTIKWAVLRTLKPFTSWPKLFVFFQVAELLPPLAHCQDVGCLSVVVKTVLFDPAYWGIRLRVANTNRLSKTHLKG